MTGQLVTAAVALAAIAALYAALRAALAGQRSAPTRLQEVLAQPDDGLMAVADATRERLAPSWPWGEPEPCGCRWWARATTPGGDPDPVWRPCDEHADQLLRIVRDREAEL